MAMQMAHAAASRSEDPWTKVGAVALTSDNRVIAVAYNGLLPGFSIEECPYIFTDRERRRPYMVHAEQNLASLIKRNEAHTVVTTVRPCSSCLLLLASHGIRDFVYELEYETDITTETIAKFYKLNLTYASTTVVPTGI